MVKVYLRKTTGKYNLYTVDQLTHRIGKAFTDRAFLENPNTWTAVTDVQNPLLGREVYPMPSQNKILVSGDELRERSSEIMLSRDSLSRDSMSGDPNLSLAGPADYRFSDSDLIGLANEVSDLASTFTSVVETNVPLEKTVEDEPQRMTKAAIGRIYAGLFQILEQAVLAHGNPELMKGITAELKEKFPDGHWITIKKEGPLQGRRMFVHDGKIVHGAGSAHWFQPDHPRTKIKEAISAAETPQEKATHERRLKEYDAAHPETLKQVEEPSGQQSLFERPGAKIAKKDNQTTIPGFTDEKSRSLIEQAGGYTNEQAEREIRSNPKVIDITKDAAVREIEKSDRRPGIEPGGSGGEEEYSPEEWEEIAKQCLTVKPVRVSSLIVNPELMQFKTNITNKKTGVTEKLKDVETWDPELAGQITLWRSPDGSLVVGNGHHRVELAQRLAVKFINATIYDSKDGFTASDVRRLAAENNIANGSASLEDAVKYLRETGYTVADMKKKGIPMREGLASAAFHTAKLSDEMYRSFLSGTLSPKVAEAIGKEYPDDAVKQSVVFNLLQTGKFGKLSGEQFQQFLPSFRPTIDRAIEAAEKTKAARVQEDEGGGFGDFGDFMASVFEDDDALQNAAKIENYSSKVRTELRKLARKTLGIAASAEKLTRQRTEEIRKDLGIDIKSDADLSKLATALRELDYRLENYNNDPTLRKNLDAIIDKKGGDVSRADKWEVDADDIRELKRYYVDEYDKHNLLKEHNRQAA